MRLFDMDSKEDYLLDGKYKVCTPYASLVDVIKVVRCKDCKHYFVQFGFCGYRYAGTDETDYCSRAERREDGEA